MRRGRGRGRKLLVELKNDKQTRKERGGMKKKHMNRNLEEEFMT